MTPQEFKAWFDGFTENVDKQPTQKQWARIKERVAEIDGKPVTERVYVDRYWSSLPYNGTGWVSSSSVAPVAPYIVTCSSLDSVGIGAMVSNVSAFDSLSAMHALGTTDAAILSN